MSSPNNIEVIIMRVQNGFLFGADEKTIRAQLEKEGLETDLIEAAISRGARAARVRLGEE